jgi:hypothetical protein
VGRSSLTEIQPYGAGNEEAARHSLELLGHAGDAFLTDSATISALLRKPAATV